MWCDSWSHARMRVMVWFVLLLVASNMVAVLSAPSSSSTSASTSSEYNISKLVNAVCKLQKDNYHLWLAGIITVLMTGAAYVEVKKAIVMFKENCERTLIEIKTMIYTQIVGGTSGSTDRQDEYNELNGKIFQLVNLTIREVPEMASIRKYGAKKAFEKGIEYLKHIYDTLGQGGTSNAAVYTAPPCDLHRTDLEDHGGSMLDGAGRQKPGERS